MYPGWYWADWREILSSWPLLRHFIGQSAACVPTHRRILFRLHSDYR
jgi:hypothetical protein